MNFEQPWGWFFAVLLPAIVILYLLKLKRIDTPISSILLWKRSLEDLKANSPFQKLRRNLLLFIQLLIAALGVFALTAPVLQTFHVERESLIVLLDASASMGATDVQPSRMENAKLTVREIINGLSGDAVMTLIVFADQARVEVPMTGDRRVLLSALNAVQVQTAVTKLDEALGLAFAAAKEASKPRVVIVSDGAFESQLENIPDDLPVQLIAIGTKGRNVGITELATRRNFEREGARELLVGISAVGEVTGEVYLSVYERGGAHPHETESGIREGTASADAASSSPVTEERRLVDARRMEVRSGRTTSVLFEDVGNFSERLELELDATDDLAVDNHAWVALPSEQTMEILLVSNGFYALEKLLPLIPGVHVARVDPARYVPVSDVDLTIFDAYRPTALPPGSYLFLGAVPPLEECTSGEVLELPTVVWSDRFHPLTRYVNFSAMTINKTTAIGLPPWADVIVKTRETPLVATLERGMTAIAVVGFHPSDSDWPFRVSFPIFFGNAVEWFRNRSGILQSLYRSGEPIPVIADMDGTVNALLPNGEMRSMTVHAGEPAYIAAQNQCGFITLSGPHTEDRRIVAVNLLSNTESAIESGKSFQLGERIVEAETVEEIASRNLWWPVLFAAMIVLTLEWFVYTRRAKYTF